MKRGLILAAVVVSLFISIPTAIRAEKNDWSDTTYAFKNVQKVMFYDLDTTGVQLASDIVEKNLIGDFTKKMKDTGKPYVTTDDVAQRVAFLYPSSTTAVKGPAALQTAPTALKTVPAQTTPAATPAATVPAAPTKEQVQFDETAKTMATIYVVSKLVQYRQDGNVVPAHTEWRSRWVDDVVYDHKGHAHTVSREETYPEYVPDTFVPNTTVEMRFDIYDSQTGKNIFSREEARTRYGSDDTRGVYNRIIDSFFKTLKEKITD